MNSHMILQKCSIILNLWNLNNLLVLEGLHQDSVNKWYKVWISIYPFLVVVEKVVEISFYGIKHGIRRKDM